MIRFPSRLLIATLSLAWLVGCQSDEAKFADHLERGDGYVETEQWAEAVIEFRNALQLFPNSGEAHYKLSQAHLKNHEAKEAFWELRETVRLDPENLDAVVQFAQLSIFAGELEEALQRADDVIAADPEHMEAYVVKAQAHEGLKQIEEAGLAFAQAVETDPEALGPLLIYGEFLRRNGDRDAAEPLFRKAPEVKASYQAYSSLGAFLRGDPRTEPESEAILRKAVEVAESERDVTRGYGVLAGYYYQKDQFEEAYAVIEEGIGKSENPLDLIYLLARMYRSQGDGAKADELVERATRARPDDPAPFLVLSSLRGRLGDVDGALEAAERAVEVAPENNRALLRRAEVLIEVGMRDDDDAPIEEARRIVDEALDREPSLGPALFVRAKLQLQAKELEEAIRTLRSAIDVSPDWAEAHFMLGTALMLAGERTAARTELARALEIDPTQIEARNALARVHAALGEHEYAVEEGRRYLAARPESVATRILVAQSLLATDQADEALQMLDAISDEGRDGQVHYALGRIYIRLGDRATGRAELEQALAGLPNQPEVLTAMLELDGAERRLEDSAARIQAAVAANGDDARLHQLAGTLALAQGSAADAEKAFKRAIEVDGESIGAYRQLANLYARTGRTQETIDIYEKAVAVRPEQPQLHHVLGVLYEAAGTPEKAIEHYEAAIRYAPEQGESKNNLAYIYAERGQHLDRALDLAQEAKQLLPDDPNTADTLGWVLHRRGVPTAAIGYLREAEAGMAARMQGSPLADPANLGLVRRHLALAYQASGDVDSAKTILDRALLSHDSWVEDQRAQGREIQGEPAWYAEASALRESL